MNNFEHIETFGNGMKVWAVEPGQVAAIAHNSILIHGSRTYSVGTCNGYAAEGYGKGFGAVREGDEICRDGIDSMVWINQRGAMICAGQHSDHGKHALKVDLGQLVWLEGKPYMIEAAPNQNLKLVAKL